MSLTSEECWSKTYLIFAFSYWLSDAEEGQRRLRWSWEKWRGETRQRGISGENKRETKTQRKAEQCSSSGSDASISQLVHISKPVNVLSRSALIGSNCIGLKLKWTCSVNLYNAQLASDWAGFFCRPTRLLNSDDVNWSQLLEVHKGHSLIFNDDESTLKTQ